MKIDKVILSVNSNKDYLDFWPTASYVWKECLGIDPILLFIARNEEEMDIEISEKYGKVEKLLIPSWRPNHVDFDPIKVSWDVSIYNNARIWYACQMGSDVCTIGDIDCIPLSDYFFDYRIKEFSDDEWIWLESQNYVPFNQHALCYAIAKGDTFKNAMGYIEGESLLSYLDRQVELYRGLMADGPNGYKLHFKTFGYLHLDEVSLTKASQRLITINQKLDPHNVSPTRRINRDRDSSFTVDRLHKGYYLDVHSSRPIGNVIDKLNFLINHAFNKDLPTNYVDRGFNYIRSNPYMIANYKRKLNEN